MKINKLLSFCMASAFTVSMAHASTHCDGYEIKIVNKLDTALVVSKADLIGAILQPKNIEKIASNSTFVFTISNTSSKDMNGEFVFKTVSVPQHAITISYKLKDKLIRCGFDKKEMKADGLAINESDSSSQAVFTIG